MEHNDEWCMLEYETANASAESHNTMSWTLISGSIVFTFAVFEGFFSLSAFISAADVFLFRGLLIIIGTFALIYSSHLIEGAHQNKIIKYRVCQSIEKFHLVGQNIFVDEIRRVHEKKNKDILGIEWFRIAWFILYLAYFVMLIWLVVEALGQSLTSTQGYGLLIIFVAELVLLAMAHVVNKNAQVRLETCNRYLTKIDERSAQLHKNKIYQ